jgi:tryptophan synthase beta subunit
MTKTQELDAANELIRKLRSEYQNTRQDAEGMLQVMGGLERQLNEYAGREAEVEKKARVSKEMQEEASILKEQVE